ncbi:hypothetical protein SynROS8604_01205 [Synechococcus sp. ROS8604]|nr:hypothetical protein SynROS8604_01205 [Synechococcus sp. ROS8604]
MDSDWNLSAQDWTVMSRCNRAAEMLFPYSSRQAEAWSLWAFKQFRMAGQSPEELRDIRCPRIKELHQRRPPKTFPSR